jgi:hypothetical protein
MADMVCTIMGIADIVAGALIIIGFGSNIFGVIFGIMMIGKGGFSFL